MKMRIVLEGLALTEGTSRGVLVRSLAQSRKLDRNPCGSEQ